MKTVVIIGRFSAAIHGIIYSLKNDKSILAHVVIAVCVIFMGVFFVISNQDWLLIATAICAVIFAEMTNSAMEQLSDVVDANQNIMIKRVKDVMAGAVLMVCIYAVVIGIYVFYQPLVAFFGS